MQANNLLDAYNNFYYQEPLVFQGPAPTGRSPEFWVDRAGNPSSELKGQALASAHPQKFLFAGQTGAGKSTELNRLMADPEIGRQFLAVYFSAKDYLDLADATYVDLLLATAGRIIVVSEADKLPIQSSLKERIQGWRGRVVERLKQDDESWGANVSGGLQAFFANFLVRLKRESVTRTTVRQIVETQLSDLMEILVALVREVNVALGPKRRQMLVIIEDLDKIISFESAQRLFQNAGPYFSELPMKAIVTCGITRTSAGRSYWPRFPTSARSMSGS